MYIFVNVNVSTVLTKSCNSEVILKYFCAIFVFIFFTVCEYQINNRYVYEELILTNKYVRPPIDMPIMWEDKGKICRVIFDEVTTCVLKSIDI